MKKRILFNESGLSKFVETSLSMVESGPDIYDVPDSPTGFYKRQGEEILPVSRLDYEQNYMSEKQKKARAFPSIQEQVEAIWKILEANGQVVDNSVRNRMKT